MKKIVIGGEGLAVSATAERALRVLKDWGYVAKKGAFEEGSGNYRSTCLPQNASSLAELGIKIVSEYWFRSPNWAWSAGFANVRTREIEKFFGEHPRCQSAVVGDQGRVDTILEAIDG
tara:strand:+ start:581 stop:934 length:354 start_codon:yes stop_codon:yes gene_type:complete